MKVTISHHHSVLITRVCGDRHPYLSGVASLGNIAGGHVSFRRYLRGNYVSDIRSDWERVGDSMRDSMRSYASYVAVLNKKSPLGLAAQP